MTWEDLSSTPESGFECVSMNDSTGWVPCVRPRVVGHSEADDAGATLQARVAGNWRWVA